MKDIDFDELDKAVNSLMGGVKSKSDRPEAKTLTLTTTLKEGEQPEYGKIRHAAEKIGSETLLGPMEKTAILSGSSDEQVKVLSLSDAPLEPMTLKEVTAPLAVAETVAAVVAPEAQTVATTTKLPTKAPSGRFMDVMHPSSDMKTAQVAVTNTTPPPPISPPIVVPSRPAQSIVDAVSATPPVQAEVVQAPAAVVIDTPAEPATPEVAASPSMAAEAETLVEPVAAPVVEVPSPLVPEAAAIVDAVQVAPAQEGALQTPVDVIEEIEPLSSPFLPDAKVEKRPLGGAIEAPILDDRDLSSLDAPYSIDNSADTQLTPTDAVQTTLPDELHNDLLAIETNLAEESTSGQDLGAEKLAVTKDTSVQTHGATTLDGGDDTPENGAIFDTTDYHKTISHPAKRTSEWVWIAVIVGIILVCAAGGAAFYLLGPQ